MRPVRLLAWSKWRLRTKGLFVISLPLLPLVMFWALIAIAALRQPAPPTARSQEVRRSIAFVLLSGSIACAAAGVVAALVLAGGMSRRLRILTRNAGRLVTGETLERLPGGDDEIGLLAGRLTEARDLLHQRDAALRESVHSLDTFFNLSRDLYCICGFDGYFKRVNPAWETTLGFTAEEMRAKPFLDFVHPDDRAATELASADLVGGGEAAAFENRYLCKDGSYRWLRWFARSRVDEGLIYASARDVTERREATKNLDDLNFALRLRTAELEASNRELEAFSYSVSHDLRAPLRAIHGFSQALAEDHAAEIGPDGALLLQRVQTAATRMGTLIDDLLGLSRLTRMDLHRERVNLSALASVIVTDLQRRDAGRDVCVDIANNLIADADPRMAQIALQNLLENAWKYTGKTAAARIELSATANGSGPIFHVRDNGVGFDMQYADKLFGAFQRLHSDKDFDGTGIGLAIVQRIVSRHSGRVWAESAVGAGATFSFTLHPYDDGAAR